MANIKIPTKNRHRRGCGENGALLCYWWTVDWCSHCGEQDGRPLETKNRATVWSSNSTTEWICRENHASKRYTQPRVHCSTICTSQNMKQPRSPLTEEWIKMWYTYTTEEHSVIKKNEIMPFATTWMDLEAIILREVRQRRKNIIWYCLNVESKKGGTKELIYKTEIK